MIQRRQLAELHTPRMPPSNFDCLHVFSIDGGETVQEIWAKLQRSSQRGSQSGKSGSSTFRERLTINESNSREDVSAHRTVKKDVSDRFEACLCASAKPLDQMPSLCGRLRTPVKGSSSAIGFGNHRAYHFNITDPPQLHGSREEPSISNDDRMEAQARVDPNPLEPLRATDPIKAQARRPEIDNDHFSTLTVEGKRQAQLAGEKFRARALYPRPRKMSAGQADRSSYHNRWASYEKHQPFLSSTPKSKRRAQSIAERLGSRTSRIRPAVKGLSDQAGTVGDDWIFGTGPISNYPPDEAGKANSNGQKSLVDVFESELANHIRDSACQTDSSLVPSYRSSAPSKLVFPDQTTPSASTSHSSCHQPASTAIEDGIKNALSGFEACLRGTVETLKAAQPLKSDEEILGETLSTFRDLAEKIVPQDAASLKAKVDTSTAQADPNAPRDIEIPNSQFPVMSAHTPIFTRIWDPLGQQTKESKACLLPPPVSQASHMRDKPEDLGFGEQDPGFISGFTGPFKYHPSGPIHLPQQSLPKGSSQLTRPGDVAPTLLSYVDHLRPSNAADKQSDSLTICRQQNSTSSDHTKQEKSSSFTDITTRFPTIGQFENATFPSASSPVSLIDLAPEISPDLSRDTGFSATVNRTESSGQLIKGMTATCPPKDGPPVALHDNQFSNCSIGVNPGSAASKARLLRPFDAFAAEAAHRNHPDGGIRRSATAAACNLRRPHSTVFSGNGHGVWDHLTTQQRKYKLNECVSTSASSTSLPLPTLSTMQPRPLPHVRSAEILGVRRSTTDAAARRETSLRPRDIKVRRCVDSLMGLGFDLERSRLRVYASVADGDLDQAIDMLTEDQKVHETHI